MKKYKLIKEYPGSPNINLVVVLREKKDFYIDDEGNGFYHLSYSRGEVEQYPEYWQEVKEKEYEILSFTCNKIHSVKRLSDGEVFTIGDKVAAISAEKSGILQSIIIANNTRQDVVASFDKMEYREMCFLCIGSDLGNCLLSNGVKLKQSLFTTEDEVDIYTTAQEGLYSVNIKAFTIIKCMPKCLILTCSDTRRNYKVFTTEENAKEYVIMNKPCLSINEIFFLYNTSYRVISKGALREEVIKKLKL